MGIRPSVKKENRTQSQRRRMADDAFSNDTAKTHEVRDDDRASMNRSDSNDNDRQHSSTASRTLADSQAKAGSSPAPLNPPQREAWTARGKLLLNFHDAISRAINSPEMAKKCSQIAEQMSDDKNCNKNSMNSFESESLAATAGDDLAEEYIAEANLIVENKSKRDAQVRNKSLALGFFTFISLRSSAWMQRNFNLWIRNNYLLGSRLTYSFDRLPGSQFQNSSQSPKTFLPSSKYLFQKSSRLVFDLAFSSTVAFLSGTFLFLPRPTAYVEDMAKLPLVEGKSVYAEMVCPPLLNEYRRALEQYGGRWPVRQKNSDDDDGGVTQEDVGLNTMKEFVENCSKRRKYERALLEERNSLNGRENELTKLIQKLKMKDETQQALDEDLVQPTAKFPRKLGTVSIPSPGVPQDIAVNLDKEVLSLDSEVGDDTLDKSCESCR
ncbi:hypothetical protein ACHAXS_003639 [Conticribra weissflogii]